MIKLHHTIHRRKRRDVTPDDAPYTDDVDEEDAGAFDYSHVPLPNIPWGWPTPSGVTEERAREVCEAALRGSPVFSVCERVQQEGVWDPVDSCVNDIKVHTLGVYLYT